MPLNSNHEDLSQKRYMTLLLRLLMDPHGQQVQGEVVNLQLEVLGRFQGWAGLAGTVRNIVTDLAAKEAETEG